MSPIVFRILKCLFAPIQTPGYAAGGKFLRRPCAGVIGSAFLIKGRSFRQIEAVGHRAAAAHGRHVDAVFIIVIAAGHRRAFHGRAHQTAGCGIFIAAIHLSRGHAVLHLAGLQLIHKPACAAADSHILDGRLILAAVHHTEQVAVQAKNFMAV